MSKKSKLTQAQREQIVEMYKSGMKQKAIAEKMGCTIPNVSYLVKKDRERERTDSKEISHGPHRVSYWENHRGGIGYTVRKG